MHRVALCLCALPLLLSAGNAAASRSADTEGSPPEPLAFGLPHSLPDLMDLGDVPGLSIALVGEDGVDWSGAYGTTVRGDGRPVDRQTVFEAASLSKTVFAYLAARLADRGVLDLDLPLVEYAPYARLAADPRHRLVTARMCLSHTTGLPNWGTRFAAEPGVRFTYSGEGIRFLRKTVEAIIGQTLEDVARKEVFTPLGMDRSSFLWRGGYAFNHAAGHGQDGRPRPRRVCPDGSAAASLMTTAGDYGRFLSACLRGDGLSPAMHREFLGWQASVSQSMERTVDPAVAQHVSWGLGWGRQTLADGDLIWHWGDNGDSVAFAAGCPGTGTGVVFFANSASGLSLAKVVMGAVFPGRPWCLEFLGYEPYNSPQRVAWVSRQARGALEAGDWGTADRCLRHVLKMVPGQAWASGQLRRVQLVEGKMAGGLDTERTGGRVQAAGR